MLIFAAVLNFVAAFIHLLVIYKGPDYYRLFGAGEKMAMMAEQKHFLPPLLTLGIAGVLTAWGLFCLSLSGVILPLPWASEVVWLVTILYCIRAIYPFLLSPFVPFFKTRFMVVSSLIVGVYALVHLVAVWDVGHSLK